MHTQEIRIIHHQITDKLTISVYASCSHDYVFFFEQASKCTVGFCQMPSFLSIVVGSDAVVRRTSRRMEIDDESVPQTFHPSWFYIVHCTKAMSQLYIWHLADFLPADSLLGQPRIAFLTVLGTFFLERSLFGNTITDPNVGITGNQLAWLRGIVFWTKGNQRRRVEIRCSVRAQVFTIAFCARHTWI